MTLTTGLIFFFAWAFASFFNGLAGIGLAMVALPIVASFMPPQILVPTSSVFVMTVSFLMLWQYRTSFSFKSIFVAFLATIPGSIIGVMILVDIPAKTIQLYAGILILLFVVWQLVPKVKRNPSENIVYALIGGFFCGVLNSSISFGAPPLAIYAMLSGWEKEKAFANINGIMFLSNLVTMGSHASVGLYTINMFSYLIIGLVAIFAGMWLSKPIAKKINTALFIKMLLLLLTISGITCVWRGLV